MQRLSMDRFPRMITASIAATILTLIPVATVGLNHHMTMQGYFPLLRYSPTRGSPFLARCRTSL